MCIYYPALMIRRPEVQVGRRVVCFALGHLSFSDHIHWFKVASPTAGQGGEEVNVTEMFVNQSDTLYSQYNIAENRRPRQYASSLNIRQFDVADEGTYTCRLSRNWSASYHIILPLQGMLIIYQSYHLIQCSSMFVVQVASLHFTYHVVGDDRTGITLLPTQGIIARYSSDLYWHSGCLMSIAQEPVPVDFRGICFASYSLVDDTLGNIIDSKICSI